jgi:hypothetical protein
MFLNPRLWRARCGKDKRLQGAYLRSYPKEGLFGDRQRRDGVLQGGGNPCLTEVLKDSVDIPIEECDLHISDEASARKAAEILFRMIESRGPYTSSCPN